MTAAAPADRPTPSSAPARELAAFLDEVLPDFERQWGTDRGFAARLDWQRRLHSAGWVAPSWPEEFGGRALGVADRVACDLVLGQRKAPTIAGILGVNNVGPTLQVWGTDEQKAHLPKILAGDEIWCQGFSEPEAGSDLAGLRMQAIRDGDHYVVNGQKIWTSQGMEASHCLLLVRTDLQASKHKGISAIAVPLDLPGIERRPLRQINGEADFAELFFTDVRVPAGNLLGNEGDGWLVTMTTLMHERAGVITMSAMLEAETTALLAANARTGDGPALSPSLRDELVQRYVEARVLAVMGENSLADAEAGGQPGPEQSVIKLSWSLLTQRLSETKLAIAGLSGLEADGSAAGSFLGSRAATIAGGTTEVMKNILAERVLGMPREPKPT